VEWFKYIVDLGFWVVIGAVAVWYIAPTTAGGTLVIFINNARRVRGNFADRSVVRRSEGSTCET
jgi:hypothetical protein